MDQPTDDSNVRSTATDLNIGIFKKVNAFPSRISFVRHSETADPKASGHVHKKAYTK